METFVSGEERYNDPMKRQLKLRVKELNKLYSHWADKSAKKEEQDIYSALFSLQYCCSKTFCCFTGMQLLCPAVITVNS